MEMAKTDWDKEIKRRIQKRQKYSEDELVNIIRDLTDALLFMKKELNISHRDIKPQNILVFENGAYKLADFGEAKEVKISKKLNTLRGTELYMSPALYEGLKQGKNDVSHDPFKSDVFSLGFCLLYAASLNFELLYEARDNDKSGMIQNIINKSFIKKFYSDNLIKLILNMLIFDEKKRFTFQELLNFIDEHYHKK
jgi:serine/threonine protein kinase